MIVLTGGPVTWGPGFVPLGVVDGSGPAGASKMSAKDAAAVTEAQRYFAALGEMASKAGIIVDIISGEKTCGQNGIGSRQKTYFCKPARKLGESSLLTLVCAVSVHRQGV